MINVQKTKILTKAALYENAEGRDPIKFNNFCTEKSLFRRMMRSLPFGVLLYLLLIIIFTAIFPDWIMSVTGTIGMAWTIVIIVAAMIIFVALYCYLSKLVIEYKYQNVRSSLLKYRLHIRHLNKIYEAEEQSKIAENEQSE